MTSAAERPSSGWISTGNAAAVVADGYGFVGVDDHLDPGAVTGQRLVDGVVDHLENHVMQASAVIGVTDVHAGSLAHCIKTRKTLIFLES